MDTSAAAPLNEPPKADWQRVEIFGHRVRCGLVSEVEQFGTKLCQIEVFEGDAAEPSTVERYGGASIFSITPCTEEYARKFHAPYSRQVPRLALEAPAEFEPADDEEEIPL